MAELNWKGGEVTNRIEDVVDSTAYGAASIVHEDAVQRTPVETGTLRATAAVKRTGNGQAHITYGTKYARRQHEEIGWNHPGGGEAKFLENALHAQRDKVRDFIQDEIRKALR